MTQWMDDNGWAYCPDWGEIGRIVETQMLWGETVCQVWIPAKDAVVRVPATRLRPVEEAKVGTVEEIVYRAAGGRLAEALAQNVLLAPLVSPVIPLPHQLRALTTSVTSAHVRYILADEVGLGKTIEAGLIMRELKLRGLVRRTLVIAPKGLVTQWIVELRTHFGEDFRLVAPNDFVVSHNLAQEDNLWQRYDQVVSPMDAVKPLDRRRGWSKEQVTAYNRARLEALIAAGWDLVIVDEAHRLGGSTDRVARYRLGQRLAQMAPYVLLLTATPHQGKSDAFYRLLSLIAPETFPDITSVTHDRVRRYVIRTEKRDAVDLAGRPLFQPRRITLAPVTWQARHQDQRLLYQAVTEYVREGYNQALREKHRAMGFLMILMQRLVVSSTRAIKTTLQHRLEILQFALHDLVGIDEAETLLDQDPDTFYDLDGEAWRQLLVRAQGLRDEREVLHRLLAAAYRCESQGPDAKAEALLDWIYRLQAEERDPDLKVLVFTEFVPTQEMLYEFLTDRGFTVVCLNGSMDLAERRRVQEMFAKDARFLISTDAGGEGLNLQFCHVVINYDIPWNPMRLEQRIGRVDRIGQTRPVRAINFVFEDSVEHRVLEVLEQKLAVIFEELGIDKTGDVLDSTQAGQMFDELYVDALLNPESVDSKVDAVVRAVEEQARACRQDMTRLGSTAALDPEETQRLLAHPLPYWVETMTVSYLRAHNGSAETANNHVWDLTWPDGERLDHVVFTHKDALDHPGAQHLTLEHHKVRRLVMHLPFFAPGQPIPVITVAGLAREIAGFWSLWCISIADTEWNRRRLMPLFLADDGRLLGPTARHIWDQLLVTTPLLLRHLDGDSSLRAFQRLWQAAEHQGRALYETLQQDYREHLANERKVGEYPLGARRRPRKSFQLPNGADPCLAAWRWKQAENVLAPSDDQSWLLPELTAVLLVRVEGDACGKLA